MTTTIGNARLADGRSVDLDIDDEGRIAAGRTRDEGAASGPGTLDHDLGGWLLLPAMAEPHCWSTNLAGTVSGKFARKIGTRPP